MEIFHPYLIFELGYILWIVQSIEKDIGGMTMDEKEFEKMKKEIEEFEAGFPDGVYAIPSGPNDPKIRVHELFAYCKEKSVNPENLTEKERDQFLYYENKPSKDLEKMERFEKGFPDGIYVKPSDEEIPRIKFRALSRYCAEKGLSPKDLTDEERNQFIIHEDEEK